MTAATPLPRRGIALALAAGPLFGLLVISAVASVALAMGVLVLHRVPDAAQLCAVALALAGLVLAVRDGKAAGRARCPALSRSSRG